jgi:hypothetical protein
MMNIIYRIVLVLLVSGFAACTSTQSSLSIAGDDEDRDIGLGGTGMLRLLAAPEVAWVVPAFSVRLPVLVVYSSTV